MNNNNSKRVIFFPIVISVTLVIGMLVGRITWSNRVSSMSLGGTSLNIMPDNGKLGQLMSLIEQSYVDSVNIDSITEEFIPQILAKLDPHSTYISAEDAVSSNEDLKGEFDGIGIMFNMATDTVIVQNVISGGPSQKAGIVPGDRIIAVDHLVIAGQKKNQLDVVKMLRGKRGTKVNLSIERHGANGLVDFEVTRGKIPVKSVDAAFMIRPQVGYIKLLQFSRNSHAEFLNAVKQLQKAGMKHLIFDLKGNTGGYLDQATLIANEFLPKDAMIVYTHGRSKVSNYEQRADGKGSLVGQDVILLIDDNSASSSEIVVGALQDNDIGTIIGRRSFGKGLVQQPVDFADGSIVNLTIARYYTPTGRCIQRSYDGGIESYYNDFYNRFANNEVYSADSIKLPDSLQYKTPKGKIVYGGGGIMPDIYVPIDTTLYGSYARKVMANNMLFRYTLRYTDAHRKELETIKTMAEAKKYIQANMPKMLEEFKNFAAANGVPKSSFDEASRNYTESLIAAYIMRNTPLEDNGFYFFVSQVDDILKRAFNYTTLQ